MATGNAMQTNFTAGELTPRLYGQVDFIKYKNGLATAQNITMTPHGPCNRRNGFRYVGAASSSSTASYLVPFEVADDNSVILEFANNKIKFWSNSASGPGAVESGGSPISITTTYTSSEIFDIQYVQVGSTMYLVHPDHAPAILERVSASSWVLSDLILIPPPTYEAGDTFAINITLGATSGTGITATAGSAMFLANDVGRHIVFTGGTGEAVITGYTSSTVATVTIITTFSSTTVTASQYTLTGTTHGASTLTSSDSLLGVICTITASGTGIFRSTDVGKYAVLNEGMIKITAYSSATSVTGLIVKGLTSTAAASIYSLESPSWSSTLGYPRAVSVFQQRLVFAGSASFPQTVWMSETDLTESFAIGAASTDAISVSIFDAQIDRIETLAASSILFAGTNSSENTIEGTSGVITPSNINQRARTFLGTAHIQPVRVNNEIIFVQASGRRIRSFFFDFNIDSYGSNDLTFFAEHLLGESAVTQLAYADEPDSLILAVRDDGVLLFGSYYREQQVIGWSTCDTDGYFESVATINYGTYSQIWAQVKRTVNGSTVRYIEMYYYQNGLNDLHGFSDSYLTYSSPKTITGITKANPAVVTATSHGYSNGDTVKLKHVKGMTEVNGVSYKVANKTTHTFELNTIGGSAVDSSDYGTYISDGEAHKHVSTVSGLTHLEGKTVQVKVDGAQQTDKTVSLGAITLSTSGGEVVVGLPYESVIKTLKLQVDPSTTSQGQTQRWGRPIIRVNNSAIPALNGITVPIRMPEQEMDMPPDLYTGDLVYGPEVWNETGQLEFTFSDPFPVMLVGIYGLVTTNAR